MTVERDPRAATAQQYSKGLILLKKQTTYLSKALILHAYETGTFCIDCTGTPLPRDCRHVGTAPFHLKRSWVFDGIFPRTGQEIGEDTPKDKQGT